MTTAELALVLTWGNTVEHSAMTRSRGIVFGSTFGDPIASTNPVRWIERRQKKAVDLGIGHDWVNFYLWSDGTVYEGAGWGSKVRWHQGIKTPEMDFPPTEVHYVLYLGAGEDFSGAASYAARALIDEHERRYGRCDTWTKDDLQPGFKVGGNPSYVNGLAWWVHHGCAPFTTYVPDTPPEVITEQDVMDDEWREEVVRSMQTLKVGDEGPEVQLMGHVLNWHLGLPGRKTNKFTETLESRVISFQRMRNVPDDGVVGYETWWELLTPRDIEDEADISAPTLDTFTTVTPDEFTPDPDIEDDPDDYTIE